MGDTPKKLQQGVTFRYVLALSLIAILSTVAFFTLNAAIKSTNGTGYLVNVSGKQRMLSQHIALDAYRVHDAINASEHTSLYNASVAKELLTRHAKEMLKANEILSTGKLPKQTIISLSPAIYEMYFGEMNLAFRVKTYANRALSLLSSDEHNHMDEVKRIIDEESETLLKDLNKVVFQYQLEGEKKLQDMKQLETLVWIMTIFTLLLEVIFIFQPMVRHIILLNLANDKVLENLETTVELRTLHLENANNRLKYAASHDPLTGLRNRLDMEHHIEITTNKYFQNKAPYAIMMFDIDWFKKVNDDYGHDVGDMVLVEISDIFEKSIREDDKAFRAGGEEFVILLNRISYEDSVQLAHKIKDLVENHIFKVREKEFSKTVSCGLYHSSIFEVHSVKDVLKLVDTALYESKENGRNRVTIVSEKMDKKAAKHSS